MAAGKAPTYRDYLQSDEWRIKRDAVRLRALGRCEFCGAAMRDVHHVRYPKNLGTEPLGDLVAVCARCHQLSHGGGEVGLEIIPGGHPMEVQTIDKSVMVVCVSSSGNVYASPAAWADALRVPRFRRQHFAAGIAALSLRPQQAGRLSVGKYRDQQVVSWQLIAEALRATDRKYYRLLESPRRTDSEFTVEQHAAMVAFVRRIDDVTRWGWDLQSQAIAGRVAPAAAPSTLDQIALLARGHVEHATRIERLEAANLRDGGEPITVREACTELDIDPSRIVGTTRQNVEAFVGAALGKRSISMGKVATRLSGCSIVAQINLWRRCDAYAVLAEVSGRPNSHLLVDGSSKRLQS